MQISQLSFILPAWGSIAFCSDSMPLLTHNEVMNATDIWATFADSTNSWTTCFWAISNCSTSSSSFSASFDGTRFRRKLWSLVAGALRSRNSGQKAKPCAWSKVPASLPHPWQGVSISLAFQPQKLQRGQAQGQAWNDIHEQIVLKFAVSTSKAQDPLQNESTHRNQYCILLHLSFQAVTPKKNEEKIMQDFENVCQAPAKTLPIWPSLLGLRPPQPWQLRARSVLSTSMYNLSVSITFTYFHKTTSCQFLRNTNTLRREFFPYHEDA